MSYQTPWSTKASSLPSDRLRPTNARPPQNAPAQGKGKGKQTQPQEPPKSREVQRLESLLNIMRASTGETKDPKGGCFCLAREHPLSTYTPICHSCGLILCLINLPQHCCPSCLKPLTTPSTRASIISQLEDQLASTIAKEIEDKERLILEAKQAAGAFPTLAYQASSSSRSSSAREPDPPPVLRPTSQTHKVMSLTGGKKSNKVKVSAYTTTTIPARPLARNKEPEEEEPVRIPPPPPEPPHASRPPNRSRPWENILHGGVTYVPPPTVEDTDTTEAPSSSRRRRNKGKGKENAVPGGEAGDAAPSQ